MKKILKALVLLVFIATLISASFYAGVIWRAHIGLEQGNPSAGLGKIYEAKESIKRLYVEKVDDKKLVDGAVKGMLLELDDPYSSYMDKDHFSWFEDETRGYFEGIGIQIGMKDDKITVIAPIEDTPAHKAGMRAGDLIVEIDNKKTDSMNLNDAVSKIRGQRGTKVNIKAFRPSTEKELEFNITRARIVTPNVKSKILKNDIGYIRIYSFSEETVSNVRNELLRLKERKIKGLVIDIRINPGGLLDQSVKLSSLFIEKGLIVSTKGKAGIDKEYNATGDVVDKDIPLAVLVDHGSASASEIFAGAIQDYKRGIIIGEKTFGKASVQQVERLSDNTAITLTIAHYYTPKGRSIAKEGIKPDVVVKRPESGKDDDESMVHSFEIDEKKDNQLNKAIEVLLEEIKKKK